MVFQCLYTFAVAHIELQVFEKIFNICYIDSADVITTSKFEKSLEFTGHLGG